MVDKKVDIVKLAKSIAKITALPLPRVAAIMQKHPLTKDGMDKAFKECQQAAAGEMDKQLKTIFPF